MGVQRICRLAPQVQPFTWPVTVLPFAEDNWQSCLGSVCPELQRGRGQSLQVTVFRGEDTVNGSIEYF